MLKTVKVRRRVGKGAPKGYLLPSLREIRKEQMLTQQEVADRAGYSKTAISKLENGYSGARRETIQALARVLGVRPIDLIGGKPSKS